MEQYVACPICDKEIRLAGFFAQKTAIDDGSRLVHKRCNDLRNKNGCWRGKTELNKLFEIIS